MAALCLLCCVACTPQKDTPKKLKVLSWNVWHGGHSKTYPGKGLRLGVKWKYFSWSELILLKMYFIKSLQKVFDKKII